MFLAAIVVWAVVRFGNDILIAFESTSESRSHGTPANGSLEHGKRLPNAGPGFRTYSRLGALLGRTAVHAHVRTVVLEAYARFHEDHPGRDLVLGETGWPSGGRFEPHRTHRNGMSVDFMVPVERGGHPAVLPTGPQVKFGYGVEFDTDGVSGDLKIDFGAMVDHLEHLSAAAKHHGLRIAFVIFAPDLQDDLARAEGGEALRRKLRFSRTPAWVRHDEHYHVDFVFAE